MARLVRDDVCDLGIAGLNIVEEKRLHFLAQDPVTPFRIIRSLDYGHCRLAFAYPDGSPLRTVRDLAGKKIAVLMESDYYEPEIWYYQHRFAEEGAEVHLLSRLWGNESLTFLGHEYRAPIEVRESFEADLLDGTPQKLDAYRGKVLLVVNTASFCGFTPQYKGLEALHARYQSRGLVVLGFPSNDFSQEGGSNKEIADFCESTFGVKFPMFSKTVVTGPQAAPFYQQLAAQAGRKPLWNFHKYLFGRDGKFIDWFSTQAKPMGPKITDGVKKALAAS